MPAPRSAVLTAALFAMVLLALFGAPHTFIPSGFAAQRTQRDPIEDLRRQAAKARDDLALATRQWERRKTELVRSQQKLRATLQDLGEADAQIEVLREPFARLVNASYQQKGSVGSMVIFGAATPVTGLRGAADMSYLANGQHMLIRQVTDLRQRREELASIAQELQSRNAVEQARLQQTIADLRRRSQRFTKELTALLDRMQVSRDRRLALSCDPELVADARKYPNGLIPTRYLCALPQRGQQLRADAALAFYKLNSAYRKRFGRDMCVRDSYRPLYEQQIVYYQRPGYAAVPGRSNHGMGTAVDLCDGVQYQGSIQFNWVQANSRRYGWFHPAWAYSSPFEPWHWEFNAD